MSGRAFHTPRVVWIVGSITILSLPSLAAALAPEPGSATPAPREAKVAQIRAGSYRVWLDAISPRTSPAAAAPVTPPVAFLGLRIGSETREDALRLGGVSGPLTITDDLGRVHQVRPFPGRPFLAAPNGKAPLGQDPFTRDYFLHLRLPDDRASALKSIEGELTVTEAQIHKFELTAKELTGGVERKVDEFTLKVDPVKSGEAETEVRLALTATLQGSAVTLARLEMPAVTVDLHDTGGRPYAGNSGSYLHTARGMGLSRFSRGSYSGRTPNRVGGATLAALRVRGAPPNGEGPLPAPSRARPLPQEVTTHFESTLKFDPIHNDEELKSVTVYLMLPAGPSKTLPFRIDNVPLPLPGGQQQP